MSMLHLNSYSLLIAAAGTLLAATASAVLAAPATAPATAPAISKGNSISGPTSRPALINFATITPDAAGKRLQASMVWMPSKEQEAGVAVGFRKVFEVSTRPLTAELTIFADARYILWVNGTYVDRGPSRFQPNGPQYDVINVAPHLREGRNNIAILAFGNLSGGKVMAHRPGLGVELTVDGKDLLRTDESWKCSDNTRFRQIRATWADLQDVLVDARIESGDWTQTDFNDSAWTSPAKMDGSAWGPFTRTIIPRLRESEVQLTLHNNVKLPITLQKGEKLEFDTVRLVQAYIDFEIDADQDTELAIAPFATKYFARAGKQRHFTIDSKGFSRGSITVSSGRATITGLKLVERIYPFERVGSFKSNDEFLNRLWDLCARSCEVMSEDSYVDCADRERVEWMDDTPPAYEVTRTAMAGPGVDGKKVYGDPRLLGALIRRTALTLQKEGWVKAHTCSDRYDIHAKMEDRTCDWIEGQRLYLDATGDTVILRETWPAIVAQMDFFLKSRTQRGLVRGRDWVVWGNPVGYAFGEGTTLNVFVQRAFVDAAYLARAIGETAAAEKYAKAGDDLSKAINTILWDEAAGGYSAGYFEDADVAETVASKRKFSLPLTKNLAPTTWHSNVFALDRGVVPADRKSRVISTMLGQQVEDPRDVMIIYYNALQLYQLDQPALDEKVLNQFRRQWAPTVSAPWQTSWEILAGSRGSKAHIYGLFPGYLLSACVLGVQRDLPVSAKQITIEPHLGDLTSAEGTVVTEFGPVPISWKRSGETLNFEVEIPAGVRAVMRLPVVANSASATVDGVAIAGEVQGRRRVFSLGTGRHTGHN